MNALTQRRPGAVGSTFGEMMRFAEMLAASDFAPKDYKGKPANVLIAIQWGQEIGLNPLQAIQNLAVINGKPSIYGDAALALVRASPVCDDVIERIEGEGEKRTAICEARRKGKAPVIARFSWADAKRAGLTGKPGPWTQYPDRMLQMRARGFALRDAFPDVLRGVITVEEAQDYPPEEARVVGLAEQPTALPGPEPAPATSAGMQQDNGTLFAKVAAFEDQLAAFATADDLRGWLAQEKTKRALAWLRDPPDKFRGPAVDEARARVEAMLAATWARVAPETRDAGADEEPEPADDFPGTVSPKEPAA